MGSDYGEQRIAAVRARNAKNKQRGRDMELRIMRYLKGNRVPMSGSGSIKGDGQLFCDHGYVLVECKHSALSKAHGPEIRIVFNWLTKMQEQGGYMKASLSVLVFHFHYARMKDYAIVTLKDFQRIAVADSAAVEAVVEKPKRSGWRVTHEFLETCLIRPNSLIELRTDDDTYIIMRLPYFKQLIHKEECE